MAVGITTVSMMDNVGMKDIDVKDVGGTKAFDINYDVRNDNGIYVHFKRINSKNKSKTKRGIKSKKQQNKNNSSARKSSSK